MRFSFWYSALASLPSVLSAATDGLSFTYQTFSDKSVKTATTVLKPALSSTSRASFKSGPSIRPLTQVTGGQASSSTAARVSQISDGQLQVPVITITQTFYTTECPTTKKTSTPTSYKLDPKALDYPTFSTAPVSVQTGIPAPGLPSAGDLAFQAASLVLAGRNTAKCGMCQTALSGVAARMRVQQDTLADIAETFCAPLSIAIPTPLCVGLLKVASTDIGGIFPAMNMMGEEGQLLCAYLFGICSIPAPPKLDLNVLFKGKVEKPKPRQLKPITKEPLKVLHISDYHLDLRYVVGSEANCTGPVCCRVYPYTNVSAPIQEPANLFGNYLCDTPEALATSVFRAVPKVTGYDWNDFSFGIFTGDLVSHDLWELTEEYVLAEELTSYQHFFNGMGGVKMFPTLGNHDTFPQAFTAFPHLDSVLPANASYEAQQAYNYNNVSAAWENYNWLTAEEAQTVVTSGLGIYRATTKEGLVIISLNSDVWYFYNLYAYIGGNTIDPTGTFGILIDYLLEAEAANQPVWIIQHVNTGGSTSYEALPAATDLYYQIIDRFNNTIRGNFFGHTHSDEFGLFYANNGTVQTANTATGMAYIMPSVTTYTDLNAGFRYYLVDPDTFDIIDSITYYANVSNSAQWEAAGDVTWELEYSARSTYDPTGKLPADQPLSAAWWHGVTEDIIKNQTSFKTYTDLRSKLYRPYQNVTELQRNRTLCGLRSMSVPIFERCLGSNDGTTSFL